MMKKYFSIFALSLTSFIASANECVVFENLKDNGFNNDTLYKGDKILVKKSQNDNPWANNYWPNTNKLDYFGWLDIDVSAEECPEKVLTLTQAGAIYLAIDGDTTSLVTLADFSTPNYDVTFGSNQIFISGDFSYVSLGNSTSTINQICLDTTNCTSVSSSEIVKNTLAPYPNPTSGNFTIDIGFIPSQVKIFDAVGKLVKSSPSLTGLQKFSLNQNPNGIYFIEVYTEGEKSTIKMIKK